MFCGLIFDGLIPIAITCFVYACSKWFILSQFLTAQISFIGTRDYDNNFSHTNSLILSVSELLSSSTGELGTTLTGLFSNTLYRVTVFAVNGAGNGMPASVTVNTLNGQSV